MELRVGTAGRALGVAGTAAAQARIMARHALATQAASQFRPVAGERRIRTAR